MEEIGDFGDRQTGRTTRMLEEVLASVEQGEHPMVIVAAPQEIQSIKAMFRNLGGDVRKVIFTCDENHSRGWRPIYIDHHALEVKKWRNSGQLQKEKLHRDAAFELSRVQALENRQSI
jgi:hypothetical protein